MGLYQIARNSVLCYKTNFRSADKGNPPPHAYLYSPSLWLCITVLRHQFLWGREEGLILPQAEVGICLWSGVCVASLK
jgi:hypothetical protein